MSISEPARTRGLVLADLVPGALVRDALLVGAYVGLIALSARLVIPLPGTPVPITGQTFAVLFGAMALGTWRAAAGGTLYLTLGVAGLPIFSPASPVTFGYIIGFAFAAALVGWLAERGFDRTPQRTALAMVLGNLVIYAFGVPYLAFVADMSFQAALAAGVVPFLVGDAVKIALATALLPGAWAVVRRS